MAYQNLSDWIKTLENEGEIKHVSAAVDWNEEIGGITRQMLNMKDKCKALLFDNINGYQGDCTRMLTNSLSTFKHVALMLGLPKDTPVKTSVMNKPILPSFLVNFARIGSERTSNSTSHKLFMASTALQIQNTITPRNSADGQARVPPVRKVAPTEIMKSIKPRSTEMNWAKPFKS